MPSKSYSKEQRAEMSVRLLQAGLELYSIHGIKNVGLMEILKKVGISKPFFYTFYDSVQEFVVCLLDYQWILVHQRLAEIEARHDLTREEKCYTFLVQSINQRKSGILIMTQEEEIWVAKRLGKANVAAFMERQLEFFRFLLTTWNIPKAACTPEILGNLIISAAVVMNSAKVSMPFLYLNSLEQTAQMQAQAIAHFLVSLQ